MGCHVHWGDIFRYNLSVFRQVHYHDDVRNTITIRITVTARQGKFLPKPPGNEHNIRGKWYGIVAECVGGQ